MTDLRKAAEMALEAFEILDNRGGLGLDVHEYIRTKIEALRQALAQPEHEPVWSVEDCIRVIKTLLYIRGIAERGEGRAMRDDETLEQFVLGYVKKLERPEQEPVAWLIQYTDRHEFVWCNKTVSFKEQVLGIEPLYTAPPKREWVGLTRRELDIATLGLEDLGDCYLAIEAKLKEKNG